MAESNPYLAHLNKRQGHGYSNGSGSGSSSSGALDGMQPRKVNGAQCFKAMVSLGDIAMPYCDADAIVAFQENDINPFNGKPYSQKYKDIMKKRKDLPVFQQMGQSDSVRSL